MATTFARVLGNHADVPVAAVEWQGKKWPCWPLGQDSKAAFERWLESQAARPVAAMEGVLSEKALAAALERLSDRSLEGEFSFGGKGFCRALGIDPSERGAGSAERGTEETPENEEADVPKAATPKPAAGMAGTVALAAILFRVTEWDMLQLLKARQAEVMAALQKAFHEASGPEGNS